MATHSPALILAGAGTAVAALLHAGCILGGPAWYRSMGAGARMIRAAEQGRWQASAITAGIASMLTIWAVCAWSAAGLLPQLPFVQFVLPLVAAVFLARAMFFPLLKPHFPGNSNAFWYWSSCLCLAIGLLYVIGAWQAWSRVGVA